MRRQICAREHAGLQRSAEGRPALPCPSSRCQTARSAASDRAARLVPAARLCVRVLSPFRFISAFSSSPPHLRSVLPLRRAEPVARRQRQVPPQNEGQAERREAQCLNVPRSYGATSRLRGVSRPAQPGRRLSALHRGVAGPGTRCVSGVAAGDGAKARRRPLVMAGCGPAFRIRGYEPRSTPLPAPPSGSSPEDAPHERGCESIPQLRYVVNI